MHNSLIKRLFKYVRHALKAPIQQSRLKRLMITVIFFAVIITIYEIFLKKDIDFTAEKISDQLLNCSLIKVIDGDSITAKCPSFSTKALNIRLFGIDAPEMGQNPWGERSKQKLINLIDKNTIQLHLQDKDRYNRYIAKLFVNSQDIGLELVKHGEAITYYRYNHEEDYKNSEKKAKMAGLGIWSQEGAQQNPEKWRRLNP